MPIADLVAEVLNDPPFAIDAYDHSHWEPRDPQATAVIRSPEALSHVIFHPGELGVVRAFVSGELDIDGELESVLEYGFSHPDAQVQLASLAKLARLVKELGPSVLQRAPAPPEEARLRGRLHTRRRDADAVSHHYDVSNKFYRLVLGPSMTYSCAVFGDAATTLEQAQAAKHELICQKLALRPGQRLLDIGCGWGSMLMHAARHHGVRGVGVTVSRRQAELAAKRVAEAGLGDLVEIRLQDYRDVRDGPFDAISSIGMFEHVGRSQLETYVHAVAGMSAPGGRFLNHAIGRPADVVAPGTRGRAVGLARRVSTAVGSSYTSRIDSPLMKRYVFPDGELHEVGTVVSMVQEAGFEVRHLESLREHYALTLRQWVANLRANWDAAVDEVGLGRARVWWLYMAACALGFEHDSVQIHQVLAVKPDDGRSGFPLRPAY